jgi:hypothetical protein
LFVIDRPEYLSHGSPTPASIVGRRAGRGRAGCWPTWSSIRPKKSGCNASPDRPTRITVDGSQHLFAGGEKVIEFPTCNQYRLQGEMFSRAVRRQGPLAIALEDSIAMKAIDPLFVSQKTQGWGEVCRNEKRTGEDSPAPPRNYGLPAGETAGQMAPWPICSAM